MSARNPFAVLGLPAAPGNLTDDDVRNAWRRVASATHPDREDGGDPQRYADASSAYALLRTPWGRSEAWADMSVGLVPGPAPRPPLAGPAPVTWRDVTRLARRLPARIRHGRPRRLAVRIVAAAAVATAVWFSGAGTPAIAALLTGIATWLALTARGDLAPRPGR